MSSRQGQGAARRRVDVVVDRLLDAIEEPWPLHRMAQVAGYAPHHFHRLFSATMGETPHRFVSRVRVERAAALLHADPGLSLTEAAAAAGFSSPSQLSREFRARFGTTASGWDRGGPLHDRAEHRVLADLPLRRAPPGGVDAVKVRRLPGFGFAYRRILDPYGSPRLSSSSAIGLPQRRLAASRRDG
ncbi:MAG: helix-turn-helix transcriptional regulator [Nocardioidaceae bacterium]|nr:helix-turn-helix transcriptional regulator [Nocardioidaceae bacterium]